MTPLVLLPGMMCDARLFSSQIEALSMHRTIHFSPIVAHNSVEALAAETLEHAPQRFALAGLSMGGIVAMEVLRQAPDRVEKIALLDTNPLAESDAVKDAREPQIEKVLTGQLKEVMRDEMKPNYLYDGPRFQNVLDLCMDMALDLGPEVFIRQSRALQNRPDQQETLKRVQVPALILCGAQDKLCPLERHELMQQLIPNSRLVVIKNAGHLPTLEQPKNVTVALDDWLAI